MCGNHQTLSPRSLFLVAPVLALILLATPAMAQNDFVRGDCLADGNIELSDLIYMMCTICDGAVQPCLDACDADDNGSYDIPDSIYLINYLFGGEAPPPAPFPDCGPDPSADSLSCNNYQYDCLMPIPTPPLDTDYILSVTGREGAPGETIPVEVQLEILEGGSLAACSFGVAHDPTALTFTELLPAIATDDIDFVIFETRDGGWTGAIIVAIFGQYLWAEGTYPLFTARYQVLGEVGDVTALDFVDTLGEPPVHTRVVEYANYIEVTPSTISGSVTVVTAFRRSDVNQDGTINIGDPIWDLTCLFLCFPGCLDAHDSNDDGQWNIADAIYLLGYLFSGTAAPAEPISMCGADPTEDSLDCDAYAGCP
jgi:hypothetical protein